MESFCVVDFDIGCRTFFATAAEITNSAWTDIVSIFSNQIANRDDLAGVADEFRKWVFSLYIIYNKVYIQRPPTSEEEKCAFLKTYFPNLKIIK